MPSHSDYVWRERVILQLYELRGESQESHLRLQLQKRVVSARDFERPQKADKISHRNNVLERAELQIARAQFFLNIVTRALVNVTVKRRIVVENFGPLAWPASFV